MSLTLKQQRFVTEYIRTGNATEAVRQAGYRYETPNTAEVIAYENIRKPQVAKAISKALTKYEINPEWTLNKIRQIVEDAPKYSDKLKALELIGKHLRLFGEQTTQFTGDITINFGSDNKGKLLPSNVIDQEIVDK